MTTRISTSGATYQALNAMLEAQTRLAKTQLQVASGLKFSTPAENPLGAMRVQDLSRQLSAKDQYVTTVSFARSRLTFEEDTLASVGESLMRIRDLTLQAANDTVNSGDRSVIATEIEQVRDTLLDLANRKDAQGEYIFAGLAVQTKPFVRSGGSVQYYGDQGQRLQQVSETQRVADGDSGFDVFGRIEEGNGTFVTSAAATNTGTGTLSVGSVTDRSAWPGGDYTVEFTSANAWQVLDSATPVPNVVASGAYTSGSAIDFLGVSVTVSGAPAAGDRFVVRAAGSTDLFGSLDRLIAAVRTPTATEPGAAQFRTALDASLQQLDRSLEHVLDVRAGVGVRLNTLDSTESTLEDNGINLETMLSDVRDLDYAEAVSRLNLQYAGLQAAQKAMAQVGDLSLFNYL